MPIPRGPEDPGRGEVVHEMLAHALAGVLDVLDLNPAVRGEAVEHNSKR